MNHTECDLFTQRKTDHYAAYLTKDCVISVSFLREEVLLYLQEITGREKSERAVYARGSSRQIS